MCTEKYDANALDAGHSPLDLFSFNRYQLLATRYYAEGGS
jgi:hypothetical protein